MQKYLFSLDSWWIFKGSTTMQDNRLAVLGRGCRKHPHDADGGSHAMGTDKEIR